MDVTQSTFNLYDIWLLEKDELRYTEVSVGAPPFESLHVAYVGTCKYEISGKRHCFNPLQRE